MQPCRDHAGIPSRVAATGADGCGKLPARFLRVDRADPLAEKARELGRVQEGRRAVRLLTFGLGVLEATRRARADRKNAGKRWGFVHRCAWTCSGPRDLDGRDGVMLNP